MKFFIFNQHVHYRSIDRYGRSRYIDDKHNSCSEKKNFCRVQWSNQNEGLQEISATYGKNIRKNRKIDCVTGQLTGLVILGLIDC